LDYTRRLIGGAPVGKQLGTALVELRLGASLQLVG
jgi:hypothetical protein